MKDPGLRLFKLLKAVTLFSITSTVYAEYVSAPMKTADWEIRQSRNLCSLQQNIGQYGSAGFDHYAGEPLRFSFREKRYPAPIKKASLFIEPAPWSQAVVDQKNYQVFLDEESTFQDRGRLSVYGNVAETMLDALSNGHNPVFSFARKESEIGVRVSAIRFTNVYTQFKQCQQNLLPVGKRMLQQETLFFPQQSKAISSKLKEHLRHAASYLKVIKTDRLIIASETAMAGRSDKNWFQKRAKGIIKMLSSLGVSSDRVLINSEEKNPANDNKLVLKVFGPDALRFFYFSTGNVRLTNKEKQRLDLLARYTQEYFHSGQLVISSHTDSKGSRASNQKISQRRGDMIKNYLLKKGIAAKRIRVKAYGESRPAKSNRTPVGRAQNRRVIIGFVK